MQLTLGARLMKSFSHTVSVSDHTTLKPISRMVCRYTGRAQASRVKAVEPYSYRPDPLASASFVNSLAAMAWPGNLQHRHCYFTVFHRRASFLVRQQGHKGDFNSWFREVRTCC